MTAKAKAFHLHFSIMRDIIADVNKSKLICLKIANEILNEIDGYDLTGNEKYWQEVKQEIQKL